MRFTLISSFILLATVPAISSAQVAPTQPLPASAQQPGPEVKMQATTGPTIESSAVGIRPAVSTAAAASSQTRRRSGMNSSVVLMVVGGAAMVAGAIIGGDAGTIFMVAGGVVGLWGLYNYLR